MTFGPPQKPRLIVPDRRLARSGSELVIPSMRAHPDARRVGNLADPYSAWDVYFEDYAGLPPRAAHFGAAINEGWSRSFLPGSLTLFSDQGGGSVHQNFGYLFDAPPMPYEAIVTIEGHDGVCTASSASNFINAVLGVATPGAFETFGPWWFNQATGLIGLNWTNSTTPNGGALFSSQGNGYGFPTRGYWRMRVHSASSVDYAFSFGGRLYTPLISAHNPGFTPAKVGIGINAATNDTNVLHASFSSIKFRKLAA